MTNALERLVEQLRRLPGIGSKSARRLAYHLVEMPKEEVDRLVETIVEAKGATRHCSICFNLSAQDPCEFCSNPNRDQTTIMVVETSRDVIAIERSGDYKGLYHVLEGALWKGQLSEISDSIIFIDEGNEFIRTVEFAETIQKTDI